MGRLSVATLIAVTLLLSATPSHAGWQTGQTYCSRSSDNSGVCSGTFLAFRNSSQSNASAYFSVTSFGNMSFYAVLNQPTGDYFSCYVPSGSTLASLWPQAMEARGFFQITWDSSGRCNGLWLYNGSQYSSY